MKIYMRHTLTIYIALCGLLLGSACSTSFQELRLTNVPVEVSSPNTNAVNADVAVEAARKKVRETLPDAYFQGLIYSGKCAGLPELRGKLIFAFVQVRQQLLGRQVIRAIATIDTENRTMDLHFRDDSNVYPTIDPLQYSGNQALLETASLAFEHITELGLSDCDVTLTQSDDYWDIRCGPLSNFVQKCRFEIANGHIREVRE